MATFPTPSPRYVRSTPPIRPVPPTRPFAWLVRGFADLRAAPGASLLHGVAAALVGLLVAFIAQRSWLLAPGAFSGFLIVGPVLATGLYELSRRRERGQQPRLAHALAAWQPAVGPLIVVGVLLFGAATAWVLFSSLMFLLFVPVPPGDVVAFLRFAVQDQGTLLFYGWLLAGGLGAALVFACTVVSVPLFLDREIGLRDGLYTSVRACGDNPLTLAVWAAIVMLLTVLSLATFMLGFVVTVPLLGHATWHAYRDLVVTDRLASRELP